MGNKKIRIFAFIAAIMLATPVFAMSGRANIHYNNALKYLKLNDMKEAIVELQTAKRYAPDNAMVRIKLADVLYKSGKPREAIQEY